MRMSIQNKTITNRSSFLKQKNPCTDSLGGCGEYEPPWSLGYSETSTFGFQYDMSCFLGASATKRTNFFFMSHGQYHMISIQRRIGPK